MNINHCQALDEYEKLRSTYVIETPWDSDSFHKIKLAAEVARFSSSVLCLLCKEPMPALAMVQATIVREIKCCRKFGDEKKMIPPALLFKCNQLLWQR